VADFIDAVLGEREGFLALAFGRDPYWKDGDRYTHKDWTETRFRWPAEMGQISAAVDQELATGDPVDVYVCPAVRFTNDRRKGSALPPMVCWADLDGPPADVALWDTLNPYVVDSGQPDHRHAYVPLTRPVGLGAHARLNKALAGRLGGDAKWSDESLLRLPGSLNFKPATPRNGEPAGQPARVLARPWSGTPWDPDKLAHLLGVDLEQPGGTTSSQTVGGEPVDLEQFPAWLRKRLDDETKPEDASEAFHGLVGACRDAGLTQGQTVTVMGTWKHLPDRYTSRVAAEVARSWGKVQDKATTIDARLHPDRYFDKHGGLLVATFADAVIGLGPLAEGADDILWSYASGVWSPDKHVVRSRAAALLGERYRRTHGTNAEDVVRAKSRRITCEPVSAVINFRNGLYLWKSGALQAHTPDVLSTVQLSVDWDPDATCPKFDRVISQVVPADMVDLVWELIGYLLYSGNPLHKAIMLMGTGRNGKGTLLRVLVALLGERNVTAVSLHDLVNTRFSTASLFGKIANIAGDIDGTYLESTATFKAITGQDQISAEHKGRDRFDFTPWAVPVFSANKIPASSDVTTGYLSRWLVIPCPNDLTGREDRTLDARLQATAELQGIAAKAMPALRRLMARGEFDLPQSGRDALDEFTRRVDQVRTWADECADIDIAHPFVPRTMLYRAYKAWTDRDGHKPVKAGEFYDRLAAIPGCRHTRHGNGERGFVGVKVTNTAEEHPWH
jgi:P4 family phage/plasmid primase-like protien